MSNEELWTNNLTELKAFIDLNKRRPIKERERVSEMKRERNTRETVKERNINSP